MEKDAEDRVGRVKDETPERKTKLSVEELSLIHISEPTRPY